MARRRPGAGLSSVISQLGDYLEEWCPPEQKKTIRDVRGKVELQLTRAEEKALHLKHLYSLGVDAVGSRNFDTLVHHCAMKAAKQAYIKHADAIAVRAVNKF